MKYLILSIMLLGCTVDSIPQKTSVKCGVAQVEVATVVYYHNGYIITCPEHTHLTGEQFEEHDFESGLMFPDRWRAICECDK